MIEVCTLVRSRDLELHSRGAAQPAATGRSERQITGWEGKSGTPLRCVTCTLLCRY